MCVCMDVVELIFLEKNKIKKSFVENLFFFNLAIKVVISSSESTIINVSFQVCFEMSP